MRNADTGTRGLFALLEETFGETVSPEIVLAAQHVTQTQRDTLEERMASWHSSYTLPDCDKGALRPLIGGGFGHGLHRAIGIGHGDLQDGPRIGAVARNWLLYAHEIALVEPLSPLFGQPLPVFRNFLPTTLALLVSLHELALSGIIHWVPDTEWNTEYYPSTYVGNWRAGPDFYPAFQELVSRLDIPRDLLYISSSVTDGVVEHKRNLVARHTLDRLMLNLRTLRRNAGRADLAVFYKYEIDMLEWLAGRRDIMAPLTADPVAALLVHASLPSMDEVSDEDIIRIRRDEVVFAHWRSLLARHLSVRDMGTGQASVVAAELEYEIAKLKATLARQAWASRVQGAVRDFSISAISTVAGAAAFQTVSAATAAGVAGLATKAVVGALIRPSSTESSRAEWAHIALLGPPADRA